MDSARSIRRLAGRVLAGATDIREGEGRVVLAAGLLFFLVLAAVMVLRPVREAFGLEGGIEKLWLLFLATLGATLLLVPAFGWLVARFPRQAFLTISYRVCAVLLLGFCLALAFFPAGVRQQLGPVYYVFHSVFNLFVVSLFWALMADLFQVVESKRLFPAICVGGTLGAIAGSLVPWLLAERIGVAAMFVVAAGLLEAAVWTAALVVRLRARRTTEPARPRPLGGHFLAGITALARSPYVLGIGAFILMSAVVSTFLYFTELRIVEAAEEATSKRAELFALLNVWTQVATLGAQAFLAGRIMRYVGVGTALAMLPVYAAAGFAVLAAVPGFAVYASINAGFRAVQRGITRPARETLFTVLSREDKYKAKSFLDTFVSRAGDACGAGSEHVLAGLGWGLAGPAAAVAAIALGWVAVSLALGRTQTRMAAREPRCGK